MSPPLSSARHTTAFPLLALLLASAVTVFLAVLRIMWTRDNSYASLIWNLFLAWLPLMFSLAVYERHQRGERGGWSFCSLSALWLLFFPNAPYIFTDLVHLTAHFRRYFWVDLSLLLLVAFTGFLIGFLSLYLMHSVVTDRLGRRAGWLFILVVTGLTGFGIYLGRFLRWNSWDLLFHPLGISRDIRSWAAHPLSNPTSVAFPLLFATFLFLGYVMLYALTRLQPVPARDQAL